jgi:hypothetical protein
MGHLCAMHLVTTVVRSLNTPARYLVGHRRKLVVIERLPTIHVHLSQTTDMQASAWPGLTAKIRLSMITCGKDHSGAVSHNWRPLHLGPR